MTSSLTRRPWVAVALAWLVTMGALLVASPARAAADGLQVELKLTGMELSGNQPDATLTLTGTVTNTGTLPAYGVHVVLWHSRDPVKDLTNLRKAEAGPVSWGSQLWSKQEHWVSVTNSTTAFKPGSSQEVQLNATLADLGFSAAGAVYLVGGQVFATDDMSSDYQVVGQDQLPVVTAGGEPTPTTPIVLLATTPTKLVDGVFRNDQLAQELPGRLTALLAAAEEPGVSWLIDPALLDEVRDLADGYQVGLGERAKPGEGMAAATDWLIRFAKLDRSRGGRTLYANPDVNGARVAADDQVLPAAAEAGASVFGVSDLKLVVVPASGVLGTATAEFLADSGASAVVAANSTRPGALQQGSSGFPILVASPLNPDANHLRAVQFTRAAEQIAGEGGVAWLLTSAEQVSEFQQLHPQGWLPRPLPELLATLPAVKAKLKTVKPARLSKAQFAEVRELAEDFDTFTELAPGTVYADQDAAALSRARSQAFIADRAGFEQHLNGLRRLVGARETGEQIRLDASPRFVMSARSNQFPITVTNNTTQPIRVRVVVESDNPQRLRVPPTEPVEIAPGRSTTVNIRPEATSNGLVIARAHVATESGRRLTADTQIIVEVTDLGVVAWIIVIVSGLVLIGATGWRIRQVRNRERVKDAEESDE